MSDDLVKRLRSPNGPFNWEEAVATYREAADRIEKLEAALRLADAALSGANMNMKIVEKKVRKALEAES